MLAYPGYTRDRIEAELSYGELEAFMRVWKDTPPPGVLLGKLLSSIGKPSKACETSEDLAKAVSELQAAGVVFEGGTL
jgi:hypothetical protein